MVVFLGTFVAFPLILGVFSTFAIIGFLYFIIEHQVTPIIVKMPETSFLDNVAHLLLPFMSIWILIFFLIFECICNAFAELTLFADREFYSDWWNSTTYEEFARLWNKVSFFWLILACPSFFAPSLLQRKYSEPQLFQERCHLAHIFYQFLHARTGLLCCFATNSILSILGPNVSASIDLFIRTAYFQGKAFCWKRLFLVSFRLMLGLGSLSVLLFLQYVI